MRDVTIEAGLRESTPSSAWAGLPSCSYFEANRWANRCPSPN